MLQGMSGKLLIDPENSRRLCKASVQRSNPIWGIYVDLGDCIFYSIHLLIHFQLTLLPYQCLSLHHLSTQLFGTSTMHIPVHAYVDHLV
jgi:hypothetical protein